MTKPTVEQTAPLPVPAVRARVYSAAIGIPVYVTPGVRTGIIILYKDFYYNNWLLI